MAEEVRYTVLLRTLVFVFRDDKLLMMKYSGKGAHESREKTDRKGIYNPIGGHVEAGEDIVENAVKEAREEAGITLLSPKIKGVINISGFAGKNMVNFIVTGTTRDKGLGSSLEGELHWVDLNRLDELRIFADVKPILEKLLTMKNDEIFVGTARFKGFELLELRLRII
jgi:8-oxo-dGTP diphosphatase